MAGALDGIRVIDCGVVQLGPTAGALLGDLGADVIKVEPVGTGEMGRGTAPSHFEIFNRNKRGLAVDLNTKQGQGIFYRLVKTADVVLNNWRNGVAEKLKVDYNTLVQHNPKIIFGSATPWGLKGPDKDEEGMDFSAMARSGMAYQVGEPGDTPNIFISGFADTTGAFMLVQGILAALLTRERTGVAQRVDVSLLGSMVAGLERLPVNSKYMGGMEMERRARSRMRNPLWNYYKCSDSKWIGLAMLAPDKYWPSLCQALGIEDMEKDSRFATVGARNKPENSEALIQIMDRIFTTRPQKEWLTVLKQCKLICAPVQTLSDLASDPQVLENEYIIDYDHPVMGKKKTVGFPWKLSATPAKLRYPAPQLGQHNEELLLELGYSWDDISGLKEKGVI